MAMSVGRSRSMKARAVFTAVLVVMLAASACAAAQAIPNDEPWLGVWQLEQPVPASRFEQAPYKKVTSTIEPWRDGLKVSYDMVRARGGITNMEWTGRFDGRDYPVAGMDYFLTNAYR